MVYDTSATPSAVNMLAAAPYGRAFFGVFGVGSLAMSHLYAEHDRDQARNSPAA
jgi:hypothetical protein